MNHYLLTYRFSHPSVKEVLGDLQASFPNVLLFDEPGAEAFLVKTHLSQPELLDWVKQELPYSIRSVVQAKSEA